MPCLRCSVRASDAIFPYRELPSILSYPLPYAIVLITLHMVRTKYPSLRNPIIHTTTHSTPTMPCHHMSHVSLIINLIPHTSLHFTSSTTRMRLILSTFLPYLLPSSLHPTCRNPPMAQKRNKDAEMTWTGTWNMTRMRRGGGEGKGWA